MGESVRIEARLTCAYFHAGGAVRGYVKIDSPRHLYIEWGVAQVHGHLCVDSDVLTVPVVPVAAMDESFMKSLNLPDVKTFSGPTGICIYQSKPTVLYSEIDVEHSTTSHFAIGLPPSMCPSFKERVGGTHTRHYTIGQAACHLVQLTFFKQTYMPGDVVLVAFDFTGATQPCASISASLVVTESLGALSLDPGRAVHTQTLQTAAELTDDALHTHMRFALPVDATPTIDTDVVRHEYVLAFEFESTERLRWQVPVQVVPPIVPDPSHFNVPDEVYQGPSRVRKLAVLNSL
ncbi:hypothetical protein DYB37_005837 [Aphanomyces astaci]|uniref:Uncharacterized protein n=1 Tax=Aphanomyces astaci TaxID=112090 RepID=A0A3R6XHC0_APHAT|nr:hypothetical protein DYB35_004773 [Aphanomyces astaci]RHZ22776.1 hypothetical protein DYB37_005837 [Aphanomyces astaci]